MENDAGEAENTREADTKENNARAAPSTRLYTFSAFLPTATKLNQSQRRYSRMECGLRITVTNEIQNRK